MAEQIGGRILYAALMWRKSRANGSGTAGREEWEELVRLANYADACERLALAANERARVDAMRVPNARWYDARNVAMDEHDAALAAFRAMLAEQGPTQEVANG